MNKKSIGIIAIVIVIVVVFIFLFYPPRPAANSRIITAMLRNERLELELAGTLEDQAKGLSGRMSLGDHQGMLFVFKETSPKTFWMQGMLFPLDIIWLRDNRVTGWVENASLSNGKHVPKYASFEPIDSVLELNAGSVRRWGIKKGDQLLY